MTFVSIAVEYLVSFTRAFVYAFGVVLGIIAALKVAGIAQ